MLRKKTVDRFFSVVLKVQKSRPRVRWSGYIVIKSNAGGCIIVISVTTCLHSLTVALLSDDPLENGSLSFVNMVKL
jgi:hypothetical protein